jgi:arabinan endo-1,5-alpha-L-arabinosidase
VATSTSITIRPLDFKPVLNYIGRSQFSDPLFNGNIDDFRVYNYALSSGEVVALAGIVSGGTYKLTNVASGKCLDNLGATTDGATVAQWASGSSANQQWIITASGSYYKLSCVTGGKYLDSNNHTADGSTVCQWSASSSFNQQWTITTVGSYYKFINRANGKCLDTGGGTTDGSVMQFWGNGSSSNQLWTLSRLKSGPADVSNEIPLENQPSGIDLYPNPVVDELFIKTYGAGSLKVEIYTISGVKVYSENLINGKNSVSVKNLKPGIYLVKIYDEQNVVTKQVVKK